MEEANKELEDTQVKLTNLREKQDELQKNLYKHNETMKRINDELSAVAKKQLEVGVFLTCGLCKKLENYREMLGEKLVFRLLAAFKNANHSKNV